MNQGLTMQHFFVSLPKAKSCMLLFCGIVLLAGLVGLPMSVRADDPQIKDMVIANSDTRLFFFLTVDKAVTPEMEAGLKNGIAVTFTFYVELLKKHQDWPDKQVASFSFDHTLSYDNIKDEYQVKLMEKAGRVMASKVAAEAIKMMTEINSLEIAHLSTLTPGTVYTVRAKVRLAKRTLPLNIHYLVPFWGLGDFETEYQQIEFKY